MIDKGRQQPGLVQPPAPFGAEELTALAPELAGRIGAHTLRSTDVELFGRVQRLAGVLPLDSQEHRVAARDGLLARQAVAPLAVIPADGIHQRIGLHVRQLADAPLQRDAVGTAPGPFIESVGRKAQPQAVAGVVGAHLEVTGVEGFAVEAGQQVEVLRAGAQQRVVQVQTHAARASLDLRRSVRARAIEHLVNH